MNQFNFSDFIYDSVKGMTNDEKGQLLTVLAEYYFNGKTKFDNIDKTIIGVANSAIQFNRRNTKVDFETIKAWNKDVLDWVKMDTPIELVKTYGHKELNELIDKAYSELHYIPREYIQKSMEWIRDKYDPKHYL